MRGAVQPGFVNSDATTEDESGEEDDDEVTCSLADWGGRGVTEPEVGAGAGNLPSAWPEVPLRVSPARNGGFAQNEKGGKQQVPLKRAQDEQAGAKRSGSASCAEQGPKRRKGEGRQDPGGLGANPSNPSHSRLPQVQPAANPSAAAGLAKEVSKAVTQGGPAVLVTPPEAARASHLGPSLVGPSSGQSSGGISPLPTPVIEFFDRVMKERGGNHVQEVASTRDALAAGERSRKETGLLQPGVALDTTAGTLRQHDAMHQEGAVRALRQSTLGPASASLQIGQKQANTVTGENGRSETNSGPFRGVAAGQLDVPRVDGRSAEPLRQDSLYSPGDEFWSEAVAAVAAVENQKQLGVASLLEPGGALDESGGLGGWGLDTANRANGLPPVQVGEPEAALEPNTSQSPLPVRQLAFTPPELAPYQAPSLARPPALDPQVRESLPPSQEAELQRVGREPGGPPKDSVAALAAAALFAPAVGLPDLSHSLSKAPTPLNSLATCALHTGPSLGFDVPSPVEGAHDTIEESESHAEDSISQFETQPESSPEDGGALHGSDARGLVCGEVGLVQPAARTEQGAHPPVQGLAGNNQGCDAIRLGVPLNPSAGISEGHRLGFGRSSGFEGVVSDRDGVSSSHLLERFPLEAVSRPPEWEGERQPGVPAFGAGHFLAAAPEPANLITAEGLIRDGSEFEEPRSVHTEQLLEGAVRQSDGPEKAADEVERERELGGRAGGQQASQARTEPNLRTTGSQRRRLGIGLKADARTVNPGLSSERIAAPVLMAAGLQLEDPLGVQEAPEPPSAGVKTPQPPEDTEDPIECSLGTQAGPSRQLTPPGEPSGMHPPEKVRTGHDRLAGRAGPFTPLSSPFSPRPEAREPPSQTGASRLATGGARGDQPLATPPDPLGPPAGPSSHPSGAHLHQEGGTPSQPLSMATPGGSNGRASEGGDSAGASCELGHYLPAEVCAVYSSKGVARMYQWQVRLPH